jgi:hypothetical protein
MRGLSEDAWAEQTTHNALRVLPKLRTFLTR